MAQVLAAPGRRGAGKQGSKKQKPPILKTTRYDVVSAFMIAIVIAVLAIVVWVVALWLANRRVQIDNEMPIEQINLGGEPDGEPDSTLKVESPEDPTDDPSNVDRPDQETELEKVIENVVEPSETAVQQLQKNDATALSGGGKLGSKEGTGKPPLGNGPGDGGGTSGKGLTVTFASKDTLDEYARQLDFFGIEIGLRDPKARVYHLLKNVGSDKATYRRLAQLGDIRKKAKQFYLSWKGGLRVKADLELFRKNNISIPEKYTVFHFYPPRTAQMLFDLRRKAKRPDKTIGQIKRIRFKVQKNGAGYEFRISGKIIYK